MKYGIKYLLENNKTFLACGIRYGFIVRFYYFKLFLNVEFKCLLTENEKSFVGT